MNKPTFSPNIETHDIPTLDIRGCDTPEHNEQLWLPLAVPRSLWLTTSEPFVLMSAKSCLQVSLPHPPNQDDYITQVQRHRRLFEQIASTKFEEGRFHHEVGVLVVQITEGDLVTEGDLAETG